MKTGADSVQALAGLVLIAVSAALIYWPATFAAVGLLLFIEAAWGRAT